MSTLTNDLARLANSANVLVSAITVNSSAITSVNVGIVNSTTLSVGTSVVANSSRLVIGNGVGLQANGNIGAAGQVLTSNATTIYWSTPSFGGGSITAVIAGDGLTGGGTSGNVTLDVVSGNGISVSADAIAVIANSGLLANSTGVHVNSTYIGTLSANNASFLGGTAAASYQLNSTLNANIASYLPTYAGVVNGASYTVGTAFTANSTMTNTVSLVVSTNTATIGTTFYSVANGNVGIGDATPALKLEVAGNMSVDAFVENSANITTSYTITAGRNAMTAGPVTLNNGVVVEVPANSTWTIV